MIQHGFAIRPLTMGAEIVGLVEGGEDQPSIRGALYDSWLQYGLLLFRGVDSIERHLAISRCFGELEIHPVPEFRFEQNPYLVELGGPKTPAAYVYDETDVRVLRIPWHRDTAFTPDICKGAMLRMLEAPAHNGETMLADTAMAYDDLPSTVKVHLKGLEYKATICRDTTNPRRPGAFWKTVREATESDVGITSRRPSSQATQYPSVVHPVVLAHPESDRNCILLSLKDFDCFLGMEASQNDELLRYLVDHMLQPKYVYKHKWSVGDALLWDNRRCMHAACGYDPGEYRHGLRTTLAGPTRTGRYYDADAQPPLVKAFAD